MKKIISIFTIIILLTLILLCTTTFAATLDAININVDKTTVRPAEEVNLTVEFGEELGAYTFDIAYDNNIFEYVKVDGGTANDTNTKVRVTYYDQTGGSNPRTNMTITFRAKSELTTSNPTEFTVTAEGLANADASVTYDDITTPIVKNVTVEPEYVDYELKLEYTGEIVKEEEKVMTLSYSSPMGRYYEHARLIAQETTPEGANVQLLASDQANLEHDIIDNGWGDAQGFKIGGKDVSQVLQTRAIFSNEGDYTITLKLIDRDNSDQVIAEKTFNFNVKETATPEQPPVTNPEKPETITPEQNGNQAPTKLPKTGVNIYISTIMILILLVGSYAYYNKKK